MEQYSDHLEKSAWKVGQMNQLQGSYGANFKLMVINASETYNNCQAAKIYGVTESEKQSKE